MAPYHVLTNPDSEPDPDPAPNPSLFVSDLLHIFFVFLHRCQQKKKCFSLLLFEDTFTITKQVKLRFFLLFLLDNRMIRIRNPDP
jgi:hypothetical protein